MFLSECDIGFTLPQKKHKFSESIFPGDPGSGSVTQFHDGTTPANNIEPRSGGRGGPEPSVGFLLEGSEHVCGILYQGHA